MTPVTTPPASTHEMARGLERGLRRIGRGEAVLLAEGAGRAEQHHAEAVKTQKEPSSDRAAGHRSPRRARQCAVPSRKPLRRPTRRIGQRGRDRGERRAEDEGRNRHGRERHLVVRQQRRADEAAGADGDRPGRAANGGRQREQDGGALGLRGSGRGGGHARGLPYTLGSEP